eukprot:snap_masked-scaffold_1-processed-gene-1.3-mRNA-1 protein AED:1.00 eAED:1.00 QI:0/-1/0/0/-1/1/1/0/1199
MEKSVSFKEKKSLIKFNKRFPPTTRFAATEAETFPVEEAVNVHSYLFRDVWKQKTDFFHSAVTQIDQNVFQNFYQDLRNSSKYREEHTERLDQLKQPLDGSPCFFEAYSGLKAGLERAEKFRLKRNIRVAVAEGQKELLVDILVSLEKEWDKYGALEFEIEDYGLGKSFKFVDLNRHVEKEIRKYEEDERDRKKKEGKSSGKTDVAEDDEPEFEEVGDSYDRWKDYVEFFNRPVEKYDEVRKDFVKFYFKLHDTGMLSALVNETYFQPKEAFNGGKKDVNLHPAKEELVARFLLDWKKKTPKSLFGYAQEREKLSPIVSADRAFSCTHGDTTACRDHPGKLLLLLIRLNKVKMVKLALNHGLSANTHSNIGDCKTLEWTNDDASYYEHAARFDDEVEQKRRKSGSLLSKEAKDSFSRKSGSGKLRRGSKFEMQLAQERAAAFSMELKGGKIRKEEPSEKDFLVHEFGLVNALSIAVENCVSGWYEAEEAEKIVSLLIEKKANPLLCTDLALRRCINALSTKLAGVEGIEAGRKLFPTSMTKAQREVEIARGQKCLKTIIAVILNDFKKIKKHHCSRVILYQAIIEKRKEVIRFLTQSVRAVPETDSKPQARNSRKSKDSPFGPTLKRQRGKFNNKTLVRQDSTSHEYVEKFSLDFDALELVLSVMDYLFHDGLEKKYPTYSVCLDAVLYILESFGFYLNNWRFVQLLRLVITAMRENLPGDQGTVLKVLENDQFLHFLQLKKDKWSYWSSRNLQKLDIADSLRIRLKLEPDSGSESTDAGDESDGAESKSTKFHTQSTGYGSESEEGDLVEQRDDMMRVVRKKKKPKKVKNKEVEKLMKLAVKLESKKILDLLVSNSDGIDIRNATKMGMIAMAVKKQNTELLKYLYFNFGHKSHLTKAFIISLKGKYHHSLKVILDLGVDDLEKELLNNQQTKRIRGTILLFSRCIDDVLFERTVFDCENGLKHKSGFTRDEEEKTYFLLVEYFVKHADVEVLKSLIEKIVRRSVEEYDSRIWFYGFHQMIILLFLNKKLDAVLEDNTELFKMYGLNYAQWSLYVREINLRKKMKEKSVNYGVRRSRKRGRMRLRNKLNKVRGASSGGRNSSVIFKEGAAHGLNEESFVAKADQKVERSMRDILNGTSVDGFRDEVYRILDLVNASKSRLERTQRTSSEVEARCRRNGSRNFDYLVVHTYDNGASEML